MTLFGAYSSEKIYYPNEIQDLVRYALIRGVKIIPGMKYDVKCTYVLLQNL